MESFWADGSAVVIKTPDASDYVFKEEELSDPVRYVNCGNHIYLEPGEQGEYFLNVCTVMGDFYGNNPWYAVLTFDNYEFFCDLAALVKTPE